MNSKVFRDAAVFVIIISVIVFAFFVSGNLKETKLIPIESRYKNADVSDDLQNKIVAIESSIRDRKQFVFTVQKDPLEQNLIVKTVIDLEKQWRKEIESQVRLTATVVDETGDKYATFAYAGKSHVLKVGDKIKGRKILRIFEKSVEVDFLGTKRNLKIKKLPPKPAAIQKNLPQNIDANW